MLTCEKWKIIIHSHFFQFDQQFLTSVTWKGCSINHTVALVACLQCLSIYSFAGEQIFLDPSHPILNFWAWMAGPTLTLENEKSIKQLHRSKETRMTFQKQGVGHSDLPCDCFMIIYWMRKCCLFIWYTVFRVIVKASISFILVDVYSPFLYLHIWFNEGNWQFNQFTNDMNEISSSSAL